MFHELILALNGFTGDVFQYDGSVIKTRKDLQIPLMHSSELVIIDEILDIATLFKKIEEFIEKQEDFGLRLGVLSSKEGPSGIYVSSVCNGIREILNEYLDVVTKLEMEILENAYLTLNHIRVQLESFRPLFRLLVSLITKIKAQTKSSAAIVEIVKAEYDMNIPLQNDLRILTPWVNRTLYKQIINWVVFGTLFDPKGEFFIQLKIPDLVHGNKKHASKLESSKLHNKYVVDYSIVPSHFPAALTERILFIGYAVGILTNSDKTKALLTVKQKEFYEKMKMLPLDTFRTEDLDEAVEELATAVGKDLHHLVVTETDLSKHLGIVKDFYLTSRGELFHDFLLNLKGISFSKNSLNLDVRQAFTLSANRLQVQDDILKRIQVTVTQETSVNSLATCVSNMTLEMEDEWPLHILFNQESIKKYNELFRFLLQIRRLQMDLNLLWVSTRKVFRFPIPKGPAELRNIMSYFIDHLQHYLQGDVLESQFSILTEAIDKSDNFEQIRVAHATFQSNILSQSFRSSKQLRHFVEEILKVCNSFVTFMDNHLEICDAKKLPINEGITNEVMEFSKDFKRHMDLLLNLLKGMAVNPQSGQYLGQFLLRLDFNSYFSSIISGFNV